jgi:hypothetical protein
MVHFRYSPETPGVREGSKKRDLPDKLHIVHIGKFAVTGQEGDIQPVRDRISDTIDCR